VHPHQRDAARERLDEEGQGYAIQGDVSDPRSLVAIVTNGISPAHIFYPETGDWGHSGEIQGGGLEEFIESLERYREKDVCITLAVMICERQLVWVEEYTKERVYAIGQIVQNNGQYYKILKLEITTGVFGVRMLEHIVAPVPKEPNGPLLS
jgi:hypothetical protein